MLRFALIALPVLLACLVSANGAAASTDPTLPRGVVVRPSSTGLMLAISDGRQIYRLDLDRQKKPGPDRPSVQYCSPECHRLWKPVLAPAGFIPGTDWANILRPDGTHQLTLAGSPLYVFAGKNLAEAILPIYPSFMSAYSAKPARLTDGVPMDNVYWHPVDYQPPVPDPTMPSSVKVHWDHFRYIYSDTQGHPLFVEDGKERSGRLDPALVPLAAPLAAQAVGDWRPVRSPEGAIQWSYRNRSVYIAQDAFAADRSGWKALQVTD